MKNYLFTLIIILNDADMNEKKLQEKVSLFYKTPSTGGTAIDADGNLYVSDVDQQQIIRISAEGKAETILKDQRLTWCDALWIDEKGYLWLPTGQLNRLAAFQDGVSQLQLPVVIYKVKIGAKPFKS
jgi:sugar lactone lactonase YvrE